MGTFWFVLLLFLQNFEGLERKKNPSLDKQLCVCLFSFYLFVPAHVPLCLSEAHCFVNLLPGTVEAETETG